MSIEVAEVNPLVACVEQTGLAKDKSIALVATFTPLFMKTIAASAWMRHAERLDRGSPVATEQDRTCTLHSPPPSRKSSGGVACAGGEGFEPPQVKERPSGVASPAHWTSSTTKVGGEA